MAGIHNNKPLEITPIADITTFISSIELAVAFNGQYIASNYFLPTQIGIWKLPEHPISTERLYTKKQVCDIPFGTAPSLLLEHRKPVKVVAFSRHDIKQPFSVTDLLCSVNEQYLVVWNLNNRFEQRMQHHICYENNNNNCVLYARDIIPAYNEISYCVFSWHNEYIAVCVDCDILVVFIGSDFDTSLQNHSDTERPQCRVLRSHKSFVNGVEFHHRNVNILISISDDSSYIVWDLISESPLYKDYFSYLMAIPVVLSLNCEKDTVFVGTSNGHLIVINLPLPDTTSNTTKKESLFKIIKSVDCSKIATKMHDSCVGGISLVNNSGASAISVESKCLVLSLCYLSQENNFLQQRQQQSQHNKSLFTNNDIDYETLKESPLVIVGTNNAVLCLNVYTLECIASIDLKIYNSELLGDFKTLNLMLAIETKDNIILLTANSFSNVLNLSRMQLKFESFDEISQKSLLPESSVPLLESSVSLLESSVLLLGSSGSLDDNQEKPDIDISSRKYIVYPCTLLTETSVLKSQLVPIGKWNKIQKTKAKQKTCSDSQLTFKKEVKSSGYTSSPSYQTMFTPKTNNFKTKTLPKKSHLKSKLIQKNFNPETITNYKTSLQISDNFAALTCLKISPNGNKLAVGSSDSSVTVVKQSPTNSTSCYQGHSKPINSVNWSYDNKWFITTSDELAAVWDEEKPVPLIKFTKVKSNFTCDKHTIGFTKDIKRAQFYYMDDFILLASSDSFHLYKYYIDSTTDEIRRYMSKSKYKSIGTYQTDGNSITDLTAINSFYSYIVLCCTTNRSISVYDMNVGQIIQLISNVHPTVPYCLAMNSGSSYMSLPPNAYDLVLTTALTDSVKLWDLRAGANCCVRKLDQHCNRVYTCRAIFSPCGHYVLAGSEDHRAYIYDIREGTCCAKLSRHSNVVKDVAYHPFIPQLSTITLNGLLYTFTCEDI